MKKGLLLILTMVFLGLFIAGCSRKTVSIEEMPSDFTKIELTDKATGMATVLDESESQELYSTIKKMEFAGSKSSAGNTDWLYSVKFLKETKELDRFSIIDEETIDYKGSFYKAKGEGFDLNYMMSFFYQVFEAEIIEAGERLLIAPDENSDVYRSSDRISAAIKDTVIFNSDGKVMDAKDLKRGDIIRTYFNGSIDESYPAQITATRIDLIRHNNIIDAYMGLIDDIYQVDSGLNGDISMIAFDTSGWAGVTETDKEIILSLVKEKYGHDIVEGTFDELAEQGLIDKKNLFFEKGILIKINNMEYDKEDEEFTCAISKWRSGDGAYGYDVTAEFDGTVWKMKRKNEWIS